MDRILSARVNETVLNNIGSLAKRLRTSKKRVIESAIELYAAKIDAEQEFDALQQTCGVWRRDESATRLLEESKRAFRNSLRRHHK